MTDLRSSAIQADCAKGPVESASLNQHDDRERVISATCAEVRAISCGQVRPSSGGQPRRSSSSAPLQCAGAMDSPLERVSGGTPLSPSASSKGALRGAGEAASPLEVIGCHDGEPEQHQDAERAPSESRRHPTGHCSIVASPPAVGAPPRARGSRCNARYLESSAMVAGAVR